MIINRQPVEEGYLFYTRDNGVFVYGCTGCKNGTQFMTGIEYSMRRQRMPCGEIVTFVRVGGDNDQYSGYTGFTACPYVLAR